MRHPQDAVVDWEGMIADQLFLFWDSFLSGLGRKELAELWLG